MSGIVLSASVRQNLLSLQSTASLLATTQNDLATGNAVNSALDNPSSYFTAEALNNRASDINNLLDGIGNGVQVLQAANTGITSLQSLVSNAQSIANQVLQTTVGYSTKSSVTAAAVTGATADDLLGTQAAYTSASATAGTAITDSDSTDTVTGATKLAGGTSSTDGLATALTSSSTLTVNGKTITFSTSAATSTSAAGGVINLSTGTVADVLTAIDQITGTATASTIASGAITLQTGTTSDLSVSGTALASLGLTTPVTQARGGGTTALGGLTLDIAATGNGTATAITFGTGNGQISTLNGLNAALATNNLQATIDSTGAITITTSNNAASSTIGAITGTSTNTGKAFNGLSAAAPVADPNSQATRNSLVAQYNQVLQQINTTSQDSSFNGINLLEWRYTQPDVRRNRRFQAGDHRRYLQHRRSRPLEPDRGHRLPGQQLGQLRADDTDPGQHDAAHGSFRARFEPVGRGNPPGLQQEPDQRAADRRVEPDAGRSEPGSGQQPGIVDPPVDRGLGTGAGQPVAAERAATAALNPDCEQQNQTAGATPPFFLRSGSFGKAQFFEGVKAILEVESVNQTI